MQSILGYLGTVPRHAPMIRALAAREIIGRYAGTLGGSLWMLLHPVAIVATFYFVFAVGFRAQGPQNVPFVLWFVCGLVAWMFFNDALISITGSVTGNVHLVTKTVFPTEILPVVQVASGLVPHGIFLAISEIMALVMGVPLEPGRLLVFYFIGCSIVLLLGAGWLLAALQVFYRDTSQVLSVALNMLFWLTPIVWPVTLLPAEYQGMMFYNPMYYVIEGYRGALIYPTVALPSLEQTLYFWAVALGLLGLGAYTFRRLKPEFADML
jgi:lipopolysaccharide transport system permease protein/teichoic acid transport system permease protein